MKRRDLFQKAGIGSAALVSLPALADALTRPAFARSPLKKGEPLADTFTILLKGPYRPVVQGPNLGLFEVNLSHGSYSTTKIYPVSGLPEHSGHANSPGDRESRAAIGNFYVLTCPR